VSGGGYLGSFMSNQFPPPQNPADGALTGSSIDSPQVRHLRNNSKYLLPATALSRLALAGLLCSGVLTTTLLALAAVAGVLGLGLLWRSRRSEPRPWRVEDPDHYERRGAQRKPG
jgi:hypothetical protein